MKWYYLLIYIFVFIYLFGYLFFIHLFIVSRSCVDIGCAGGSWLWWVSVVSAQAVFFFCCSIGCPNGV